MDVIIKILELINNDYSNKTFLDNRELFQKFYRFHMSDYKYMDNIIEIYKYLLSLNISEDDEMMPYLNSQIYECFNNYIINITQTAYIKGSNLDDAYVNKIYKLINDYQEINKYKRPAVLTKLVGYNQFIRYCTGSMMLTLNSSFLNLSNENIDLMFKTIKNNQYLLKLIDSGGTNNNIMDRDYIFQYISRFLFNLDFIDEENLHSDVLVNAFKKGLIKDKKIVKEIIKYIDSTYFLMVFDDNLSLFVDMLEKTFSDKGDCFELFYLVCCKLKNSHDYLSLLDFIIDDERVNNYIKPDDVSKIVFVVSNNYDCTMTDEQVKYLLNYKQDIIFFMNLKENLKMCNWNEDTKKIVEDLTRDIKIYNYDINKSLAIINMLFRGYCKDINITVLYSVFKSLLNELFEDYKINLFLFKSDHKSGFVTEDCTHMGLNVDVLTNLLKIQPGIHQPDNLKIFETFFHEIRHLQQFQAMKNPDMSTYFYKQFKEMVVQSECHNYYPNNYKNILFEKDARFYGAEKTIELLSQFAPYMNNCISYYKTKANEARIMDDDNRKLFELSDAVSYDEILDKLMIVKKGLLKKYPFLGREYNLDGTRKAVEELNGLKNR